MRSGLVSGEAGEMTINERVDGHFHGIELLFLGNDLVNVWRQQGICRGDLGTDGALHGGFDLGLGAGGDTAGLAELEEDGR